MDQLPRFGKRELICLLSFTCNYVVFVWRGFLFLWVLGMGYVILLWHSLSFPYNYFLRFDYSTNRHKITVYYYPDHYILSNETICTLVFIWHMMKPHTLYATHITSPAICDFSMLWGPLCKRNGKTGMNNFDYTMANDGNSLLSVFFFLF